MNKALVSKYFLVVLALLFIHSSTRLPGKYDTIVIKHFFSCVSSLCYVLGQLFMLLTAINHEPIVIFRVQTTRPTSDVTTAS